MSKEKIRHSPAYYVLAPVGILLMVLADQLSKKWAVQRLSDGSFVTVIPGWLEFTYVENRGMAFGALQGAQLLFTVVTIIVLAAIVRVYLRLPETKKLRPIAVSLVFIFGGAVGNFIDRSRLGYVVDFICLRFIRFPVFNVADCFITWPMTLLILLLLFYYKEEDLKQISL